MSLLSTESIKIYSESVGISSLTEEASIVVAQDVEYRLREVLQDAMKFMNHSKRSFLSVNDVNDALSNRNMERIFGYSSSTSSSFKPFSGGSVFYMEDQEVDFDELLRSPLPKMPQPKCFGSHWLAIEGVQPLLPQNPNQTLESLTERTVALNASSNTMQSDSEVKPLMKHVLPKEQQVYFDTLTSLIVKTPLEQLPEILKKIKQELGLQLLLPYFIQFAAEMVARSLRNLPTLIKMIKLLEALLENKHTFVEPYLHQIMPILLTCIVGKQLCNEPSENHWSLRDASAQMLRKICKTFKSSYGTIRPRVTKTLLRAFLDPSKPLTSHYGAIVGLAALGHETIKLMVIPHIKSYGAMLEPMLKHEDPLIANEATRCYSVLLTAVAECISQENSGESISLEEYKDLYGLFGEPIVSIVSAKCQK